jgi:hypothetical protein
LWVGHRPPLLPISGTAKWQTFRRRPVQAPENTAQGVKKVEGWVFRFSRFGGKLSLSVRFNNAS